MYSTFPFSNMYYNHLRTGPPLPDTMVQVFQFQMSCFFMLHHILFCLTIEEGVERGCIDLLWSPEYSNLYKEISDDLFQRVVILFGEKKVSAFTIYYSLTSSTHKIGLDHSKLITTANVTLLPFKTALWYLYKCVCVQPS